MNTPLQTFQRLAERLPHVFEFKPATDHDGHLFFCENIELITFNAEGAIIKASQDGYDWLLEKLEVEFEVRKPEMGEEVVVIPRHSGWYVRWWSIAAGFHDYKIQAQNPIVEYKSKLEALGEVVPIIIEEYLNGEKT